MYVGSIRHVIQKAEQAVEDEELCHETWSQLFVLYGVCSLVGGLVFVINGRGYSNITADIERTAGGLRAETDSKSGTTTSTDEHDGHANLNSAADSKPVRTLAAVYSQAIS